MDNTTTVRTPIEAAYVAGVLAGRNIRKGCPAQLTGYKDHVAALVWSLIQGGYDEKSAKSMIKCAESEGLRSSWNAHGINSL